LVPPASIAPYKDMRERHHDTPVAGADAERLQILLVYWLFQLGWLTHRSPDRGFCEQWRVAS
jgi:hypothetical protein